MNEKTTGKSTYPKVIGSELFEISETVGEKEQDITGHDRKTQKVLKEVFELLEEHQPPWYLRKHYNAIKTVLE